MQQDPPPAPPGNPTNPALFALGGVVGAVLTGLAFVATRPAPDPDWTAYRTVRELIEDEYVHPVERSTLLAEALNGMARSLDPYSRFYVGDRLAQVQQDTRGTFVGLGAIFDTPLDTGQILFPMPGSPAERAGIEIGDRIVELDGVRIEDLAPGTFAELLRDLVPHPIELEVERLDGQRETLELTPSSVINPTVRHLTLLEGEVGYLAITSFSRETPGEFDLAVRDLRERGATGLLVDLRGNPGGVLVAALEIANRFVPKGVLLVTETRVGHTEERAAPELATLTDMPLVLLVDEDSASASEVLAGALQDHRRAALVGTATYGKGTIQTLTPLRDPESMLKVTTAFYTTPAGRSIDRHYRGDGSAAIWPDIEVELDAHARAELHGHLFDYSPSLDDAPAVALLEAELGRTPRERVRLDAQVRAALELLDPANLR